MVIIAKDNLDKDGHVLDQPGGQRIILTGRQWKRYLILPATHALELLHLSFRPDAGRF